MSKKSYLTFGLALGAPLASLLMGQHRPGLNRLIPCLIFLVFSAQLKTRLLADPVSPPKPTQAPSLESASATLPDQDPLKRYGNIVETTQNPTYPVRFTNPITTVGEINLPTSQDFEKRAKLERLASLSDSKLKQELNNWPTFQKMSLGDQGRMLTRIQDFRDHRDHMAADEARQMGLSSLDPAQQIIFANLYWQLRLQMDQEVMLEMQPLLDDRQAKLKMQLLQRFNRVVQQPLSLKKGVPTPSLAPLLPGKNSSSASAPLPAKPSP